MRLFMGRLILCIVALTGLAATTCPLLAQRADMLLSRPPVEPVIPDDLLVQSAARIGSTRLVVWGTTMDGAGGVRGALMAQLVDDSTPRGVPLALVTFPARPSAMVRVVPLAARFLVLWNDRRPGAEGLYGRVVDPSGAPGPERLYWPGIVGISGIATHVVPTGVMLLWNDASAAGGIDAMTIDGTTGLPAVPARKIAEGSLRAVTHPPALAGAGLLDRGEELPLILDIGGASRPLTGILGTKPPGTYYIGSDGGVITINRDTVREYRSMLDSFPARVRRVPMGDGWIPGSETVSRAADGRLQIAYAMGGGTIHGGGIGGSVLSGGAYRIVETAPNSFGTATQIGYFYLANAMDHCTSITAHATSTDRIRGTASDYRVVLHYAIDYVIDCQFTHESSTDKKDISYVVNAWGTTGDSLLAPVSSLDPSAGFLFRVRNSAGSAVDLAVGAKLVRLSAPSAMRATAVPHRYPVIRASGGRLMVGWLDLGIDSLARFGWWSPAVATFDPVAGMNVAASIGDRDRSRKGLIGETILRATGNDDIVLATAWRWQLPTDPARPHRQRYTAHRATDTGWQPILHYDGGRQDQHLAHAAIAGGRSSGGLLVAFGSGTPDNVFDIHVAGIDAGGSVAWSNDSVPTEPLAFGRVVPVGHDDFLMMRPQGMQRLRGGQPPVMIAFALKPNQRILRLADSAFLRASFDGNIGLSLERIDFNGIVLTSRSGLRLPPAHLPLELFMVEDPITRAIALLYGAEDGVRMSVVDASLGVLRENVVISATHGRIANPTAAFLGDSLYVVWEDYRDTIPAIYGTVVSANGNRAGHDDRGEERATAGVPADTVAVISGEDGLLLRLVTPLADGGSVELHDAGGRLVARRALEAGERDVRIDTQGLPSGLYLARIRSGSFVVDRTVTVVH